VSGTPAAMGPTMGGLPIPGGGFRRFTGPAEGPGMNQANVAARTTCRKPVAVQAEGAISDR